MVDETHTAKGASPAFEKLQARTACEQGDCNTATFGAYAKPTLDLSPQAWERAEEENKTHGKPWKESVEGRAAIRLFSRGVMGAAAFALGSTMARSYGRGYHPNLGGSRYTWSRIAEEAGKETSLHKTAGKFVVHGIARLYDDMFGRPIMALGNALGKDGRNWVTFRPTRMYKNYDKTGRSLGQEVVGITMDFATMSTGDALGRDIADWFDPNVKHDVYDEKGNFDINKTASATAKALWRYATYNSGEDWFVAVPYAYFMKTQRHVLNRLDPGFAYDSDRALNGASFKLNDHGRIVGNYNLTGAFDLQTRFTAYNVLTLMYREMYSEMGNRYQWFHHTGNVTDLLHTHKDVGPRASFATEPVKASLETADRVATWMARSAIKGTLYMTPAVPFFWMTRTPQMKYRGVFIHPEKGMVVFKDQHKAVHEGWNKGDWIECLHANEPRRTPYINKPMPADTEFFYTNRNAYRADFKKDPHLEPIHFNPLEDPAYNPPQPGGGVDWKAFDAHSRTHGVFDTMIQPFGRMSNWLRKEAHHPVRGLSEMWDKNHPHPKGPLYARQKWKFFTDQMMNAAPAYAPYFFVKSDVAGYFWDTGKMDYSIDGLVDGLKTFNIKKIQRGFSEIYDTMWDKPLHDHAREVEAQRARCDDLSLSDGVSSRASRRECMDEAIHEISKHERYQDNPEAQHYLERLKAERQRGRIVDVTAPKTNPDKPESFVEKHAPQRDESFVAQEVQRHSKDVIPPLGGIVH